MPATLVARAAPAERRVSGPERPPAERRFCWPDVSGAQFTQSQAGGLEIVRIRHADPLVVGVYDAHVE